MTKRLLLFATKTVVIVYAALCLGVYLFQDKLVYFPERQIEATPKAIGLTYEPVTLQTEDGLQLSAWFVPVEPARGVLLFCHGNGVNISHLLDSIRIFHRLGLSALVFDYRGYGQSEGAPSEEGTYRDAEAAWRYLVEQRQIEPNRIIIYGHSLGGSVASWLGRQHPSGAVVIDSSFTSVADVGAAVYRFLPVRLLSRFQYNTRENLQRVRSPSSSSTAARMRSFLTATGWHCFGPRLNQRHSWKSPAATIPAFSRPGRFTQTPSKNSSTHTFREIYSEVGRKPSRFPTRLHRESITPAFSTSRPPGL